MPSSVPGAAVFWEGTVNYFQPIPLVTVIPGLLLLLPSQPADRTVTAPTEGRGETWGLFCRCWVWHTCHKVVIAALEKMSIHGILKKEKDSCSVCTPTQIFFYSLVSTAKDVIAKTSFPTYGRPAVLVLGEKRYKFDARKEEVLLVFEAYWKGWKWLFAWWLKDLCRVEGPQSPLAGRREVRWKWRGAGICSVC